MRHGQVRQVPRLFKADIDAAFRRVAIRPDHRWAAGFAYYHDGQVWSSQHFATPFGAVGSVNAWDVVGDAIAVIARHHLKLPILRYVDDYFSPEREAIADHAMVAFRDLVRILLGSDAVAPDKTECSNPITILGVVVTATPDGFSFVPSPQHIQGWLNTINEALAPGGILLAGAAAKLAGGLSWGCRAAFRRFGRAMMGPIHDQRWSATGHIRPELRRTLHWWAEVLSSGLTERRVWRPIRTVALHIFCDASSRDARLGAVIWDTGVWYWTSTITPERVRASFCLRNDNQIMALELLAISLALATFEDRIRNRRIIVHCDNKGAEVSHNFLRRWFCQRAAHMHRRQCGKVVPSDQTTVG